MSQLSDQIRRCCEERFKKNKLTVLNTPLFGLLVRYDLANVLDDERVLFNSLDSLQSPTTTVACAENAQFQLKGKYIGNEHNAMILEMQFVNIPWNLAGRPYSDSPWYIYSACCTRKLAFRRAP